MSNYTILHSHTHVSNAFTTLDSVNSYDEYIDRAKELGMNAIAFTEHGNIMQWINKKRYAENNGLKYIHGVEAYVTETLDERINDNYHVVLLATDKESFLELNKLISKSTIRRDRFVYENMENTEHYYYQPRITYEDLINTSDGIVVLSACLGGILNSAPQSMQDDFIGFMSKNKHRCFLEVQHHDVEDQASYNKKLLDISNKHGIRLVAGTDTHALTEEHAKGRVVLQKSKNIHFANEDNWDLVFKSYDELVSAFEKQGALSESVYLKAIENTNIIADMVEEFEFDNSFKYPKLYDNPKKELLNVIREGIKWREYKVTEEIQKRVAREIEVFEQNQALDFILLDSDLKKWCRKNKIEYGEARGSVSGSLIAYLIGITHVDPIKYDLVFERFMHDERVGLSDIDSDYSPNDIPAIKEYLFNKHGLFCAEIITYNTIAMKGAIRDVGRAFDIPLPEIDEISKNIEDREEEYRESYPKLFKYVDILNGVIVSIGSHPAAICVADIDLSEELGIFYTKTNPYPVTQADMKEAESLNFLKLDVLKLDTVGVINDTCKAANINRIRDWDLDYSDTKVWKSMIDSTAMIFQWNSNVGESYYRQLFSEENLNNLRNKFGSVDYLNLLSIGNAAIRPAGNSYRYELANGIEEDHGNEVLNEFLKPTYSRIVYQETIMDFLSRFCGFSMGKADLVRRGLAKKYGTEEYLPSIKEGFIETMTKEYSMGKEEAENAIGSFLDVIESASDYAFSKNHSVAYSIIGFQTAYLRYYYPLEFITTSLNYANNNEEKTNEIIKYANSQGIEINPIQFGYSGADYRFDKETNSIYKGIESIKYLNKEVAEKLKDLGRNKYDNFYDVMVDVTEKVGINTRQLKILTTLKFFDMYGENGKLLEYQDMFKEIYGKKQFSKAKVDKLGLPRSVFENNSRQTEKTYMEINVESILKSLFSEIENSKLTLKDQVSAEIEYLGYIEFTEPKASEDFYIVTDFRTFKNKNRPYVTLYQLKTGKSKKTKVTDAKFYATNKFKLLDTIQVPEFTRQFKNVMVNNKWTKSDEIEEVLTSWNVF